MKVLATICARKGSQGVKGKNAKLLCGKPLIAYTIEYAKACGVFHKLVLSTDCENIQKIAKDFGLESFFTREDKMASNTAGKIEVIQDATKRAQEYYDTDFDYVIDLDVTAPVRAKDDAKNALNLCVDLGLDVVLSATPSRKSPYFNIVEIQNDLPVLSKNASFLCRQDCPKSYDLNASIYVFKKSALMEKGFKTLGPKSGIYVMDEESAYDIDSELDFFIVSKILQRRLEC